MQLCYTGEFVLTLIWSIVSHTVHYTTHLSHAPSNRGEEKKESVRTRPTAVEESVPFRPKLVCVCGVWVGGVRVGGVCGWVHVHVKGLLCCLSCLCHVVSCIYMCVCARTYVALVL